MAERALRLSPRARADLEDIWIYTARQWSADQADRYHDQIMDVLTRLADGSLEGRRTDIREGYQKHPAGSHMVYFKQSDRSVDVMRILHQRMDVDRHL